jgi:hypothetical protein
MTSPTSFARAAVALLLAAFAAATAAESGTAKALITWDGEGHVFKVGTTRMLFLGDFEGIFYVETDKGVMDEAFVRCPATMNLDAESGTTSGKGHCAIHVDAGDTVYATWTCAGKPGYCEGTFTLEEGTGKFEGISGSSPMRVRSPLRAMVADMSSGSVVQVGSGIAILSKLEYRYPGK